MDDKWKVVAGQLYRRDGAVWRPVPIEEAAYVIQVEIEEAVAEEREACALVAMKEGYPEWDEDIPQRHRDSWEQCALRIMSAIRSRTEGEGK